jgi:acetyl-CoA C-acetyltransferase
MPATETERLRRHRAGRRPAFEWTGLAVIRIAGSAAATTRWRFTIAVTSAVRLTNPHKGYRQAGVGPQDIDVFELHDAFSIMSALSLEACGFAERG